MRETMGEGESPDEEVSTSHKTLQGGIERVGEIGNGIESQIRNDSRRLWKWIGRQLCQEKSRKAMVIKKGLYKW